MRFGLNLQVWHKTKTKKKIHVDVSYCDPSTGSHIAAICFFFFCTPCGPEEKELREYDEEDDDDDEPK